MTRRWARPLAALTVLLALAGPTGQAAAAGGATAAPTHLTTTGSAEEESPDGDTSLDVEITEVGPAVLGPDQTLTVRGTVSNDTGEEVATPVVRLRVQRSTPVSRSSLEGWLTGSGSGTVVVAREDLPAALPDGAQATFAIEVPAADLPLVAGQSAWGPRGVEAEVTDDSGAADVDGADRSYLLWSGGIEPTAMPVGVLVPVTATAEERTEARADGAPVVEEAGDRLADILDAVAQPGVTLAVDGELLTDGSVPEPQAPGTETPEPDGEVPDGEVPDGEPEVPDGETETPEEEPGTAEGETGSAGAAGEATPEDATDPAAGSTDPNTGATDPAAGATDPDNRDGSTDAPAATAPAERPNEAASRLVSAISAHADAGEREVSVLPWADADVAALTHTGRPDLLTQARERATAAASAAGLTPGTALAWPATDRPDQATVAAAAADGASAVVLPASAVPADEDLTYTPSARGDVAVGNGSTVPGLLVDERASAVLTGVLPGEDGDDTNLSALDARQLLLGTLAVIARERPSDPRAVVLALPRGAAGDRLTTAGDALAALMAAPWVTPTTASGLAALPAPSVERESLPDQVVAADEVDAATLTTADSLVAEATSFATITPEPGAITEPVVEPLSTVPSAAWRRAPGARSELVQEVASRVAALDGRVRAMRSSTLNVINSSANVPVTVRNELAVDVTVSVSLDPVDPRRLRVPEPVELVVPASGQATAQVPVRAVGSGDVSAEVVLLGPQGQPVGTSTDLQVRVRADWENVGTAVVAGVLGVMLVVGLVRTVRRGPRLHPDIPVPDEEDA